MAQFNCPECNVDLEGRSPRKHALSHWPEFIPYPDQHVEAVRKQKMLLELQKVFDAKRKNKGEE